ncbi:hypothetical protein CEXT_146771 [Caerostris extrusa]|uniref:Uncharacterized protein n=1 Tax=Caerostris extrusa TaxID=172846 RepID=A0AAV4VVX5_CAEEX|nr:hypothetical protein CEXT_146771 [Caerostris extrusa]
MKETANTNLDVLSCYKNFGDLQQQQKHKEMNMSVLLHQHEDSLRPRVFRDVTNFSADLDSFPRGGLRCSHPDV